MNPRSGDSLNWKAFCSVFFLKCYSVKACTLFLIDKPLVVYYSNLLHCSVRPLELLGMIKDMIAHSAKALPFNGKLQSISETCTPISPRHKLLEG